MIPLAFHVDYWNYIGWQDPFSSEAWSNRQRAYATAMGLDTIYTPQVVLNGGRQIVGANEAEIRRGIRAAASPDSSSDLQLRVIGTAPDGTIRLEVVASVADEALDRRILGLLALYQDGLVTPVTRGENARHTLANERVVRRLQVAMELQPGGDTTVRTVVELSLNPQWPTEHLGVALFLQDPRSMEVSGAVSLPLGQIGVAAQDDSTPF